MSIEYLKRILNARVYEVAEETPLDPAPALSARLGNRVLLKREDMQPVFSFKLRGAYNKMANLSAEERARGVICASAGNHAQGVALSARKLGCRAVIVMPVTTPTLKVDAVRARGGEVVLQGDSFSDAYQHALKLQAEQGLTFVHPFDDPDVIAGQGTIAMEILRQHRAPVDAIFVAIGGGGLIAGIAAYVKAIRPGIKIIGVETYDADAMRQSLAAGQPVTLDDVGLFADGTAVKRVGDETFALCKQYVDDIILVDTDQICAALKDAFEDTRAILEPSGALALAGLKAWAKREQVQDRTLVAVASGANMNFDRLRFVSERAGASRRHRVQLPHCRFRQGPYLRGHPGQRPRGGRADRQPAAHGRLRDPGPDRRRSGQVAPAPPGGRALAAGPRRGTVPLRVPRAPRGAAALPGGPARRLEHLAVPLSQSRVGLWARPGRYSGTVGGPAPL